MPDPIPTHVAGAFGYQFHQVAIYTASMAESVGLWHYLGYTNWIEDRAELVGFLDDSLVITNGHMMFNYDIMPMELELLHYDGPNRHEDDGRTGSPPFISHMSTYVDSVFAQSERMHREYGLLPYHRFVTTNHQNPGVAGKKRFIECIYDTRSLIGHDIKLIQKVPQNFDDSDWLDWDIATQAYQVHG